MGKPSRARKALNATPSVVGDKIRGAAMVYEKSGQHERAEGMRQAAGMVDKHARGGSEDLVDFALMRIDEAVSILTGIRRQVRADLGDALVAAANVPAPKKPGKFTQTATWARAMRQESAEPRPLPKPSVPSMLTPLASGPALMPCERAILTVLKARGKPTTRRQILILSRYRDSGSFAKALTTLKGAGYITAPNTNVFTVTPEGSAAVGHVMALPTGPESVAYWANELGPCAGGILKALARTYPHSLSIEALIDNIDAHDGVRYSNPPSGSFHKALTLLRKLELMEGTTRGEGSLHASDTLMTVDQ